MDKLTKLIYACIVCASRQPRWWLLAILQAAFFSLIGQLARPNMLGGWISLGLAVFRLGIGASDYLAVAKYRSRITPGAAGKSP